MEEKPTTIKIRRDTKERLDKLKVYRRESYDEIVQKILEILNNLRANPDSARAKLIAIDRQKIKK